MKRMKYLRKMSRKVQRYNKTVWLYTQHVEHFIMAPLPTDRIHKIPIIYKREKKEI